VIIEVRSIFVAFVPVFDDKLRMLLLLQVLMLFSLYGVATYKPWRTGIPNVIDSLSHLCLVIFVTLALVISGSADKQEISDICTFFFFSSIVLLPVAVIWGVLLRLFRSHTKFRFFLCHHKAASGIFARTLKTYLLGMPGLQGGVFLDTDDLKDLGTLFGTVASDTHTLVILVSNGIWCRHWCIGEIATASLNRVRIDLVILSGGKLPSTSFIEEFEEFVPEFRSLSEFGLEFSSAQTALRDLRQCRQLTLSGQICHSLMDELVKDLIFLTPSNPSRMIGPFADTIPETASTVILTDSSDMEAVACGLLLKKELLPRVGMHQKWFPYILGSDEQVSSSVTSILYVARVSFTSAVFSLRCSRGRLRVQQ